MRTLLIAVVVAVAAGFIYYAVTENKVSMKDVTDTAKSTISGIAEDIKKEKVIEKSAEYIDKAKENIAEMVSNGELTEKAMEELKKITAEEKREMCHNSIELYKKYESKAEPANVGEQALFLYFDKAKKQFGEISPDMYDDLVTSFCNSL